VNSNESAYDMLTKTATFVEGRLTSILRELKGYYKAESLLTVENVMQELRVLRNELSSALSRVPPAPTTEPQTSGKTKSNSISKNTLEAIEVSALVIAQATKILAENDALHLLSPSPDSGHEDNGEQDESNCTCFDLLLCDACKHQLRQAVIPGHWPIDGGAG